jgi:hypothetical protein
LSGPDNGFRCLYKCAQKLVHGINIKMCTDFLSCSQSRGSLRARDCHSVQTLDLGSLPSISELYVTALPGFKSTNNSTRCMLTSSQTILIPMDPHGICVLVSECSVSRDQTEHLKIFFSSPFSSPFSSVLYHT